MPEHSWRRSNTGHLLYATSGRVIGDKLAVLHGRGFAAVTDAQLALFHNLAAGGSRLTELAARAGLTKPAMIELVDRAERIGLVQRLPDPEDRRAKIVVATPAGEELLAALRDAIAVADRRMADRLGTGFVGEMLALLGLYIDARQDITGRALALAARRFARDVLGEVHRHGHPEITEVQLALYRNLDIAGTRLTDLAVRARTTKQSMREQVDRAEALGFVERRRDPADGRAKVIAFTEDGLAMLQLMKAGVDHAEAECAAILGSSSLDRLRSGLHHVLNDQAKLRPTNQ